MILLVSDSRCAFVKFEIHSTSYHGVYPTYLLSMDCLLSVGIRCIAQNVEKHFHEVPLSITCKLSFIYNSLFDAFSCVKLRP